MREKWEIIFRWLIHQHNFTRLLLQTPFIFPNTIKAGSFSIISASE
jgi:hypothetical protein